MKLLSLLRYNRIYWKLFGIIGLTNLAIIALVAFVLAHNSARNKYVQNYQSQVQLLAQVIVDEYETNNALPYGKSRLLVQLKRRHRIAPELMLDIKDDSGNYIYKSRWRKDVTSALGGKNKKSRAAPIFKTLQIEGNNKQGYTVFYLAHRPPQFIVEAMASLVSFQLVLIFITSAIISALISWRIVKPLRQLGDFGQQYAKNYSLQDSAQTATLVDTGLLKRGDEIGDLARDVANMVQQVDKAFSAQKSLLHDVSHELRAPLARLQVAASLIEQREGNSLYVGKIHEECSRLNALIDEVLELARMGSAKLNMAPIALALCVEAVVKDVRFEFPQRHIQCDFSLMPQPVSITHVMANAGALSRALENIIRNACKYSPEGRPIDISIAPAGHKQWQVCCRDYGNGMQQEELALLKRPFYRGGGVMHGEGFGLGLSIADKAIKQHGGKLIIDNHTEGGLSVQVILNAMPAGH
ncbi:sensor histidine kinase [Marinagarivorans cellulosilyticus]|uniref:histidine kinase n=1 Tax=Marinagarivorans cellulosilyticus TaxID=2721545 RepID=A0AAN1WF94_9GAMM|nr:HAMP domain-containing sensor histidine kinase [Marinagarivorans cellulosilyticus]BCD96508.1 two-component system, OmpR family, sensor kinase [Marinagarivorans cellulosilyticus]